MATIKIIFKDNPKEYVFKDYMTSTIKVKNSLGNTIDINSIICPKLVITLMHFKEALNIKSLKCSGLTKIDPNTNYSKIQEWIDYYGKYLCSILKIPYIKNKTVLKDSNNLNINPNYKDLEYEKYVTLLNDAIYLKAQNCAKSISYYQNKLLVDNLFNFKFNIQLLAKYLNNKYTKPLSEYTYIYYINEYTGHISMVTSDTKSNSNSENKVFFRNYEDAVASITFLQEVYTELFGSRKFDFITASTNLKFNEEDIQETIKLYNDKLSTSNNKVLNYTEDILENYVSKFESLESLGKFINNIDTDISRDIDSKFKTHIRDAKIVYYIEVISIRDYEGTIIGNKLNIVPVFNYKNLCKKGALYRTKKQAKHAIYKIFEALKKF